ncbi:MAG: S9 family peptidase [Chloroflexi bacterium]|nr:S9 family peptidase [Chloroflexota bacterium]
MEVSPPPASPRETVVDLLHGEHIEDPYRWLEDPSSERVRSWTSAQNARTRAVLDRIPQRARFAARLRELLAVGLMDTPRPVAGKLFHLRREGEQRQVVLYVRDALHGEDRALVDPNGLDPAGLTTIDWWYPSRDGALVAYGLSHGGTEMSTLHVIEVATGHDTGERIEHTQRASVAWTRDGFFYTAHPAAGTVAPGDEHYFSRVRHHRLGDDPARDEVIFGEGRPKEDIIAVTASPDGRWTVLLAYHGWLRNDAYLLDGERPERGIRTVIEGETALTYASPMNDRLWLVTNLDAPNYRIVAASPDAPSEWTTIIPEGEHPIEGRAFTRDRIAVHTLEHATSRLTIFTADGRRERDVALPGVGSIDAMPFDTGLRADREGDLVVYQWHSFADPATAHALDVRTGVITEIARLRRPAGIPEIVVDRTRYRSKDGTEVPMFLIHRADVRATGSVPTVLNGYGGFNVARTPAYSAATVLWAEQGGLFAVANLRGGAEYGERWHRDGMLAKKQNVFDDFHAAAEHLAASGWTRADRLGIWGGSNGGLLVGAAMTQRPELYGAVVCAVPLLDMLRYQHLLIARLWIAEYGSSEDAEQFRWLRAYSPYQNVRAGRAYPPILLTTAEGDSRVDPMHARKMAALLQCETHTLALLRVDVDAGHGIGKPLDKQVDDAADWTAFLAWRLGLAEV